MAPSRAKSGRPAGFTLVELLVVIAILLTLAALLVPALRPMLESRRIREAARLVNVFLGTARNRAVETGRPVGVIFHRDPSLPQGCVKLQQAEVPPPYAGDYQDSRIRCDLGPGVIDVSFPQGERPFPDGDQIVQQGDQLQLNYQGHIWTITSIAPGGAPDHWSLTFSSQTTNRPPYTTVPVPFQFFRQPVPSLVPPITLPAGAAVDLFYSGTEEHLQFAVPIIGQPRPESQVTIVFSPNGAVQGYYYLCQEHLGYVERYHQAISPFFFLVGRRDRVTLDLVANPQFTTPAQDGLFNVQDLNNLWVAVNPQTGIVTTTEVASAPSGKLVEARRFAREAQRMGGQ